ncbi:MAG TPA: glutathione S-transferase family protein [Polyangiaceae bacterium]
MSLELYFHPLASYCWKVLVALYENETPFEPRTVDLGSERERAELAALWPMLKFPVLHDHARDQVVPESTIINEYLALHYPGRSVLVPCEPDVAQQARLWDRFFDQYVHEAMQKIVLDKLRPAGQNDAFGVGAARSQLEVAYGVVEQRMASRRWALGDDFTLADCAAAPALHYANRVAPFGAKRPHTAAYLARLEARPSFARVLREAEPYFHMFPG